MVQVSARQITARNRLEAGGFARSGAAALIGNFCRESGPSLPSAFRKVKLDHGSNGLPQWRLERLTNYENYVKGLHPEAKTEDELWPWYGRMDHQLDYVMKELEADYPALNAKLREGGDAAALAADVCWQYERPSKALSGISERIDYAKALSAPSPAATASPTSSAGVVPHLRATADSHRDQAQGALILASFSTAATAGVVGSNFVDQIPTWQYVAVGVLVLLLVVGVVGYFTNAAKARKVEQAIPGVTPNAPPAAEVAVTPVAVPAAGAIRVLPKDPDAQLADFEAAVQAEVQRRMDAVTVTKVDRPTGLIPHDPAQGGLATTVGMAMTILDKDGKPVVPSNEAKGA